MGSQHDSTFRGPSTHTKHTPSLSSPVYTCRFAQRQLEILPRTTVGSPPLLFSILLVPITGKFSRLYCLALATGSLALGAMSRGMNFAAKFRSGWKQVLCLFLIGVALATASILIASGLAVSLVEAVNYFFLLACLFLNVTPHTFSLQTASRPQDIGMTCLLAS